MRAHLRRLSLLAIILGIPLAGPPVLPQDAPPALYILGSEVVDLSSPAAVGELEISLDSDRLRAAAPALSLALPGAGEATARLAELRSRGGGNVTWIGRLDSGAGAAGGANVVLTLEDGVVSGIVFAADRTFQIVPREGGHRLAIIDPDLFPDCAGGIVPPWDGERSRRAPAKTSLFAGIDLMAVYTPAARAAAGGVDEIEATIRSAVDVTNVAYANSGVNAFLVLVHAEEVGHAEAASIAADLDWVSGSPAVAALRDAHHADVVSLIVAGGTSCGISFVQTDPDPSFESSAFQVTRLDCAFANLTLAHEIAHLQGAEHNPEDSVRWPSGASFPWSFGHYHHGGYRTVMSLSTPCSPPCPRQPYFSNPDVDFGGLPTGVAGTRENYRTLNETAWIVAGFRTRPPEIFADDFESGGLAAWSCVSALCEL